MAVKKSQIYSQLWNACNALRGGMDASQYKDYILTLLFVKYVSDRYDLNPKGNLQAPTGGHFKDLISLKNSKDIGNGINIVIGELAKANDLTGVIDIADFNDDTKFGKGEEMINKLTKLIGIFENMLNLAGNSEGDDLLGDAYEYLMRKFATESGKSKGQFYTPAEASIILSGLLGLSKVKKHSTTLYDPTCGSGSLLIKGHSTAPNGLTIYGQEKDIATTALTKMNMILHNCDDADIAPGGHSTLATPHFIEDIKAPNGAVITRLKQFDYIVSNPPFSLKNWTDGVFSKSTDQDQKKKSTDVDIWERFEMGMPPTKNGDYAWLLHIYKSMEEEKGKAAVILPHGVLFRGGAEQQIRTKLLELGVVKAVIGLPTNLFYGTGIPACIIVMDKENAAERDSVFFIDASHGFIKDGNKNRLRQQDIHKILDTFNNLKEEENYSKIISKKTIKDNDFSLNISRYIDSGEIEDTQDIYAHLNGGIPKFDIDSPKMNNYWLTLPNLKEEILKEISKDYYSLKIKKNEIRKCIFNHPSVLSLKNKVQEIYESWFYKNENVLRSIDELVNVKDFINEMAESLLSEFKDIPLLNYYDIYQQFMEYCTETIQDDVYLIKQNGYLNASLLKEANEDGEIFLNLGKKSLKYKSDTLPASLIADSYFKSSLNDCMVSSENEEIMTKELKDFEEENSGEDSYLDILILPKKDAEKNIKTRLKKISNEIDSAEEIEILKKWLILNNKEKEAKKVCKELKDKLNKELLSFFDMKNNYLTEDIAKNLIVNQKWFKTINNRITNLLILMVSDLTNRISELAERYEYTLSDLDAKIIQKESLVKKYLTDSNAMRDLLTGSKTLEGFTEPWDDVTLGKYATFSKGVGLPKVALDENGKNSCIHYGELFTYYTEQINETKSKTNFNGVIGEINDVLMPTSDVTPNGLAKASCLQIKDVVIGGDVLIIRPNEELDGVFLSFVIKASEKKILSLVNGSTVFHIYGKDMAKFAFKKPKTKIEQKAISNVLLDIQSYMDLINLKSNKIKYIKQGMTQQLLGK